ncbi:ATP-binding cassette domain-containing protein [Bacillus sp. AFS041924]|uniref:ATP-binding cassette domain-containing protein n=1 Tax=Bacillus sp. AFS041924 TaxID=2033503 RepID=UPI000BFE4A80|nr:ATP-binding cassette domain-containing protein [Bacillus sp. AFS041924]PGS55804.1 phosphate ABC transporter ATP-binding protein [Bacillus sp. AFS041924]
MTLSINNISVDILGNSILKNISFQIKQGEIFCLIGTSGAGKSTLLRTFNRLQTVSNGEIQLNGQSIHSMTPQKLRKSAVMILQTPSLFEGTVEDNILFGLKLNSGFDKSESKLLATSLLEKVGLESRLLERNSFSLSIGQQQRVSIARAIAMKPSILLCDEITSALDPQSTLHIQDLLVTLKKQENMSIILVTHNMDLVQQIADRVGLLIDGKLVEVSSVNEFFNNPSTELGRNFLSTIA